MSFVRPLLVSTCAASALAFVGCAKGSVDTPDTGRVTFVDGGLRIDAAGFDGGGFDGGGFDAGFDGGGFDGGGIDSGGLDTGTPTIDTGVDAPVVMPDTPICTPATTQLLLNPNLDASPLGTGWVQSPADPGYPPITTADIGIPWQSGSSGIAIGILDDVEEGLAQTVTIPAGTTRLVMRGYYGVGTDESGSTPYDVSAVFLTNPSGAVLETALEISNANAVTAGSWTPFTYTFANPHPGEAVRISIEALTDGSYSTLFVYDTLSLEASVACP